MISLTQAGQPTIRHWLDPQVQKQVFLRDRALRIIKYGATPKDTWRNYAGLNPRVEICTPTLCAKEKESLWTYTVRLPKNPEAHVIIFQLMDREDDGTTPLPVFQFIIRKNILHARYAEITPAGKRGLLVYQPLCSMDTLWDQWFTLSVKGILSYTRGYMSVTLNGKLVWARKAYPSASRAPKPLKLAYGVYGYPGPDVILDVKKITYTPTLILRSDVEYQDEKGANNAHDPL